MRLIDFSCVSEKKNCFRSPQNRLKKYFIISGKIKFRLKKYWCFKKCIDGAHWENNRNSIVFMKDDFFRLFVKNRRCYQYFSDVISYFYCFFCFISMRCDPFCSLFLFSSSNCVNGFEFALVFGYKWNIKGLKLVHKSFIWNFLNIFVCGL